MDSRVATLEARIRSRGLPESVVLIAVRGGESVHPSLEYRAEAVSPSDNGPAWTITRTSGRDDLVPLWSCGTSTAFSCADGSFLGWDAEEDEPSSVWPDFTAAVRSLLTDLWEDETSDDDLAEVARLLLPEDQIASALVVEER